VTEDLPAGNAGSYDTTLTCDNGVVPDDGSFTITAALADTTVTCTFTNTIIEVAGSQGSQGSHGTQGAQPAVPISPPADVPTSVDSGLPEVHSDAGDPGRTGWLWLVLVAGGLLTALTALRTGRRDPS
jgi:hypothetical protein